MSLMGTLLSTLILGSVLLYPHSTTYAAPYSIKSVDQLCTMLDSPSYSDNKLQKRSTLLSGNQSAGPYIDVITHVHSCITDILTRREQQRVAERLRLEELAKKQKQSDKYIALTFDDGPDPDTFVLLDLLAEHDVVATFFVLGRNVQNYPHAIQRMTHAGHEIGNHGRNHHNMLYLSRQGFVDQMTWTDNAIIAAGGFPTSTMRPTYGTMTAVQKGATDKHIVYRGLDSKDWKSRHAPTIHAKTMRLVQNKQILLYHDIHPTTIDAMRTLIPALRQQGYEFVTVSELIRRKYGEHPPHEVR